MADVDVDIVKQDQVSDLKKKGFHAIQSIVNSKEDLSRAREDYNKFYDIVFVSSSGGTFTPLVRGAIFSKEYLLSRGYQLWEGYAKEKALDTTELLNKFGSMEQKGPGFLVCEEDKKVYTKAR